MSALDEAYISCPYCGEVITILIDSSAGNQNYVEDCQVCCSPIIMNIEVDEMLHMQVTVQQEND